MKYELELKNEPISNESLIADMQRVAKALGRASLRYHEYKSQGRFSPNTITRRFGGWNKALELSGLTKVRQYRISDEELFKNLEGVWTRLGRQPRREEISKSNSKYSGSAYEYRFKTWNAALRAFAAYINAPENSTTGQVMPQEPGGMRSPRGVSDRLRFRIMKRDNFKCRCGRSPATDPTVILHIDHIKPWSKGGKTSEDNLETLCSICNQGKGNTE
jgi:hypothetical protein